MPAPLSSSRGLFKAYLARGREVVDCIFRALAEQLCLPSDAFTQFHDTKLESGTVIRLIRYEADSRGYMDGDDDDDEEEQPGLLAHTDFGSITLLANILGGLQVLSSRGKWEWVKPEPGCLIVNTGDAMVEWTRGVLRSNMHRVLRAPGNQGGLARVSFAMLVRPFKEAKMGRLVGGRIPSLERDKEEGVQNVGAGIDGMTAWQWELKKAMALKKGGLCEESWWEGAGLMNLITTR
ncbi:hypothetical protein BDV19DRAFT_388444 [Aspergillus venezuelensis]